MKTFSSPEVNLLQAPSVSAGAVPLSLDLDDPFMCMDGLVLSPDNEPKCKSHVSTLALGFTTLALLRLHAAAKCAGSQFVLPWLRLNNALSKLASSHRYGPQWFQGVIGGQVYTYHITPLGF